MGRHTLAQAPSFGSNDLMRWLLLLLALGACRPSAPPPMMMPMPPAPAPATLLLEESIDDINQCRQQVVGLQHWLRSIEKAGMPLSLSLLDEGARLVERAGPAIEEPAPLVHVTTAQVFLDGVPVVAAGGLQTDLTALIELRRNMMPESPFIKSPRCYLAVDSDVPWARVVAVATEATAAGVAQLTFLFRDSNRSVPAPPLSPIDAELDRMKRGTQLRRQQITAELLAYVYQDCPEGLKVIANMGVNPVADFKQVILEQLPTAIGNCGCAADDASVKALHWAVFGNPRPTSGITVRLALDASSPGHLLETFEDVTWDEAHQQLVAVSAAPAAQPVRLFSKKRPTTP
jgi:hypothetical protein